MVIFNSYVKLPEGKFSFSNSSPSFPSLLFVATSIWWRAAKQVVGAMGAPLAL
jgi:hypothetical protein